jgi:hypothetical protein
LEDEFIEKESSLDSRKFNVLEDWILITEFRPIIAALVSMRASPNESVKDVSERLLAAKQWHKLAEPFLPRAFLIDTTNFIISDARPNWNHPGLLQKPIKKWQLSLRRRSFRPDVLDAYHRVWNE